MDDVEKLENYAKKSVRINKEFMMKFLNHIDQDGIPVTMTATTLFINGIFEFGKKIDEKNLVNHNKLNDSFIDALNLELCEFNYEISKIGSETNKIKIETPNDLMNEEAFKTIKKIDNELIFVFNKYFKETSPVLAMTAVASFISNILASSKETDDKLFEIFVNSLNILLRERDIELIVVST